ncbi:MAG: hypothetical protein ACTIAH_06700 [Leuconostoc mesenteroides]
MTQVLTQATKKVGNMMNEVKFGNWLKEFKSVDRPIGNLAKDMLRADDVEKFNRFKTVEDIPHELPYKVYEVAVEVFEYYLIDSVDKYDIGHLEAMLADKNGFTELTDYQRGLVDGFVSGLKPARNISDKSRGTYEVKHDFEALLRLNNVPAYIPQEQAEQILAEHGFEVKHGITNINNTDAMYSTRKRLDISENGVIVKLDWNDQQVD